MLLDIPAIHNDSRNCYEDLVASVALWWGRRYEMMFAEAWGFAFHNLPGAGLGEKLEAGRGKIEVSLEKHHGISVQWQEQKSASLALDAIRHELGMGNPVCLNIDKYWCPWGNTYKEGHDRHYCLVGGVDETEGGLSCIDPFFHMENDKLSVEDFLQGYGAYAVFRIGVDPGTDFDWKGIIRKAVDRLGTGNGEAGAFDSLRRFSKSLREELDMGSETHGYGSVWFCPLFLKLRIAANGRNLFSATLRYLAECHNVKGLASIADRLEHAGRKLMSVQSMLVKTTFLPDQENRVRGSACEKMEEIAGIEEKIAEDLLELTGRQENAVTRGEEVPSPDGGTEENAGIRFVDISSHLNNHGFGSMTYENCSADLSRMGHLFLREGLPEDGIFEAEGMKFGLPFLGNGVNDNISCRGQKVEIPDGEYTKAVFLGCCDFGESSESVVFEYSEGVEEVLPLEFASCFFPQGAERTIVWTGPGGRRMDGKVMPVRKKMNLYVCGCKLGAMNRLERIRLPYNPNLHIFAISLLSVGADFSA